MSQTEHVTAEDVEKWAEVNDFDEDDLDNFASAMYVATSLIGKLDRREISDEGIEVIDSIHRAILEASSISNGEDFEFVEPMDQYAPSLDMKHPLHWTEDY